MAAAEGGVREAMTAGCRPAQNLTVFEVLRGQRLGRAVKDEDVCREQPLEQPDGKAKAAVSVVSWLHAMAASCCAFAAAPPEGQGEGGGGGGRPCR